MNRFFSKNILFISFFLFSSLHAGFLGKISSLFSSKKEEIVVADKFDNYLWQQVDPELSQEELQQKIDKFVNNGDSYSLNSLLNKIDDKTKKEILNKRITVLDTEGESFDTTFLYLAVNFDDCEIVKVLIKHGSDVNLISRDGSSLLDLAVFRQLPEMVKLLIGFGADINQIVGGDGFTPLNTAVYWDLPKMVELLIKLGADIALSGGDGFSPLTRAVLRQMPEIIKLLVDLGADINACDEKGSTSLDIAVQESSIDIIKLLINLGADINLINENGSFPLKAAVYFDLPEIAKLLISLGADINQIAGGDGFTPLNTAVYLDLPKMVELLIKLGADITLSGGDGFSPLNRAVVKQMPEMIKLLVDLGADINQIAQCDGYTPLNTAVYWDLPQIGELLIKLDADINLSGLDGFSPLTRAVARQMPEIIKLLVDLGADINASDENENTPLDLAMRKSYFEIVSLLINLGADINITGADESLPLHTALKKGNESIARELIATTSNINAKDYDGNTALHIAIEESCDNLVPLLLKHGADANLKNDNNVTPILLASSYCKKRVLKQLFKKFDPSIYDYTKALDLNDIEAFKMLLDNSRSNPFLDKQNKVELAYSALALGERNILNLCKANDSSFMNRFISGHAPLHFALMHGHDDLARHLIDQYNLNISAPDLYGLTPLHYAVIYGNYEMTNYLTNKKCDINAKTTKNLDFYKSGSTPYDMALQLGYADIINFLENHKAKKNTIKRTVISDITSCMALFIDSNNESVNDNKKLASVKLAFSTELKQLIKQKACPAIIIGQHLLHNALELSSCLKDWLVVEILYENIDGYIIIPKRIVGSNNLNTDLLDSRLKNLGFDVFSVEHSYVDETYVLDNKINKEELERDDFSSLVPSMIDSILIARKRFVYWGGHGYVKTNPSIGCLSKDDASELLKIFANKKAKLIYLSSCFFGGKNFEAVDNYSDMIVVSGTTAEIITRSNHGTRPLNWTGFFNALAVEEHYKNNNTLCQYLSDQVLPLLVTAEPNITNFPHIKLPGNNSFTLLSVKNEALLLDKKLISQYKYSDALIVVEKKRLLEVDVDEIKTKIKIKNKIPLIISNNSKNIFEQIRFEQIKDLNVLGFVGLINKLIKPYLFEDSTIENSFLVKEFRLPFKLSLNIKNDNKTKLPETLYNVLINRGPGCKCDVFLSTSKNLNQKNSILISYDNEKDKWDDYSSLSPDEFFLYQQLRAQSNTVV